MSEFSMQPPRRRPPKKRSNLRFYLPAILASALAMVCLITVSATVIV